jgi:hypothetical protein
MCRLRSKHFYQPRIAIANLLIGKIIIVVALFQGKAIEL